jgi:hypothetical protein
MLLKKQNEAVTMSVVSKVFWLNITGEFHSIEGPSWV